MPKHTLRSLTLDSHFWIPSPRKVLLRLLCLRDDYGPSWMSGNTIPCLRTHFQSCSLTLQQGSPRRWVWARVAPVHSPQCPWHRVCRWWQRENLPGTCLSLPIPSWDAGLKLPWGVHRTSYCHVSDSTMASTLTGHCLGKHVVARLGRNPPYTSTKTAGIRLPLISSNNSLWVV